ncbi:MAG: exodeoxyribonuclease VII small subunit [Candidatus Omnitrophica bacterium]|nr:exodeoxyribonuclease VII small subunit [Candidatus Omnitrophota bacterium]
MAQSPDLKYEEALKRLEKLVAELDRSELDLESRLKKFEEGTKLARLLAKKLDQAKKKVEVLVKTSVGETTTVAFDDDAAEDGSPSDDEPA